MTHPIPDGVGEAISPLATRLVASKQQGNLTIRTVPAANKNLSRDSNGEGNFETGPSQGTPISQGVPDIGGSVVPPQQENAAFRGTNIPRTSEDVSSGILEVQVATRFDHT